MSISILDIVKQLLDMDKILYLPKTKIIKDEDLFDTYFNLIDHKTLFKLLEEEDLLESDITINLYNIFNTEDVLISDMDIDKYNNIQIDDNINKIQKGKIYDNNDINLIKLEALDEYSNNLKEINEYILKLKEEIKNINNKYNNFECIEKYKTSDYFNLLNFVINCSDYSNKNVNWYNIILNIDIIDNDFNNLVNTYMKENKIPLNYYKIKKNLDKLKDNNYLKNIFKKKILECSVQPSRFFKILSKSISFNSWNEYLDNCSGDCLLYLNKDYKEFLKNKDIKIKITEKILILIYCEYRLIFLSKYIILEGYRLYDNNTSIVSDILSKNKDLIKKKKNLKLNKELELDKFKNIKEEQIKKINIINNLDNVLTKNKAQVGGGGTFNMMSSVAKRIAPHKKLQLQNIAKNKLSLIKDSAKKTPAEALSAAKAQAAEEAQAAKKAIKDSAKKAAAEAQAQAAAQAQSAAAQAAAQAKAQAAAEAEIENKINEKKSIINKIEKIKIKNQEDSNQIKIIEMNIRKKKRRNRKSKYEN